MSWSSIPQKVYVKRGGQSTRQTQRKVERKHQRKIARTPNNTSGDYKNCQNRNLASPLTPEEAAVSTQEFNLQDVLEQAENSKPNSPFFSDFEKHELKNNPLRKEAPKTSCHSPNTNQQGLDSKSTGYFTALDSTIGDLEQRTQQLIDKINENRKQDHVFMNNFRESLLMKVSNLAEKLEESVFHVYDHNSKIIQDKLEELSDTMERIRQFETELKQVCHTMEILYKDICGHSEL